MTRVSFLTVSVLVASVPLHTLAQSAGTATVRTTAPANAGRVATGTRSEAFTTIKGTALNTDNTIMVDAPIRLRDARAGRIVDTTITDKSGLFAFQSVDPGSYVVEVLGADHNVIAASQILNVNAGDVVSAIVKLPFRIRPYAGVLGRSTGSAALIIATAAASGVLATQIAGQPVSPPG